MIYYDADGKELLDVVVAHLERNKYLEEYNNSHIPKEYDYLYRELQQAMTPMPDHGKNILPVLDDNGEIIGFHVPVEKDGLVIWEGYTAQKVYHMPLPEPPKEESR